MSTSSNAAPVTVFTPSFADEDNTNAQNLTVKEIVARLSPEVFRVTMLYQRNPDPRLLKRPNTTLLPYYEHGNAVRLMARLLLSRPDIYFYPRSGPLDRGFFNLRRTLKLRTAVVTHIVMEMNDKTAGEMISRSILEADAVFGNSDYVTSTVRNRFAIDAKTIHNGIDGRFFFPPGDSSHRPPNRCSVLYAGSFQERKRVELVIRAAARWPEVDFQLAGQGKTEPDCHALCASLGCKNVQFLGHLSLSELGDALRRADVFLFPSILEGHPQVLGQAAACGVPVVAMDVYHPDYVIHGQTGFLVESDEQLHVKLGLLLTNADLRRSMSMAARQHSRNFDWDKIAARWAQALQTVVANR